PPCSAPPHPSPLSLHDALPISSFAHPHLSPVDSRASFVLTFASSSLATSTPSTTLPPVSSSFRAPPSPSATALASSPLSKSSSRSEEHTSELQSRENLVCRLLL